MIKSDNRVELELDVSHLNNKGDIRNYLLEKWSQEDEGLSFRYFVERLSDGKRVYLERPANLNKGCDFVILAENLFKYKNGNDKPPKHVDLLYYIRHKKENISSSEYRLLIDSIYKIFQCENVSNMRFVDYKHELILKLSKWFFIEQDITYWAKSVRNMLWRGIKDL